MTKLINVAGKQFGSVLYPITIIRHAMCSLVVKSSSPSSRTSDGQSSLADKCCGPLQIREAAVELLGLQSWLGPGPHSQFFIPNWSVQRVI